VGGEGSGSGGEQSGGDENGGGGGDIGMRKLWELFTFAIKTLAMNR
jgi:hypothetical protein